MNIHWAEYRTNNSVHEQSGIPSIEALLVKNNLRWIGHVIRMKNHRLPKQLLYGELSAGKRKQGGQRKRFKDNLKHYLKCCFFDLNTWKYCAKDRAKWRAKIHLGVGIFEDGRMEHREELRKARKRRQASNMDESGNFKCPQCPKICSSRIGLHSHLRIHK